MPEWLSWSLLFVFAVHLAVFGRRWRRTRALADLVLTLTFALLVLSITLRLAAPEAQLAGVALYWFPRVLAWAGAAMSLTLYIRRRARKRYANDASR